MAFEIDLPLGTTPEADDEAARLASRLVEVDNERFLEGVLAARIRVHHRSTDRLLSGQENGEQGDSLLLRALHLAFSAHLPISLSPDLFWYAVVHEVAVHVRLNADEYAGLFTDTPGQRQTIVVVDHEAPLDWQRSINLVQQPLRDRIGERLADLFQPSFTTTTPADATAALVALMDVASPYFDFRWVSLCGIPRIRLEGTAEDWQLLVARTRELADRFDGLRPWFTALFPVLAEIAATAAGRGVDTGFWRSIYKYEERSGDARVTGWINAFFAHRYTQDGPRPRTEFGPGASAHEHFPSHVSRVPYRWETPAGTFDMAFLGGVLGLGRDGEWLRPRLGNAVVELLPTANGNLGAPLDPQDLARAVGTPEYRPLESVGTVTYEGAELRIDHAFVMMGYIVLVRSTDGDWYTGNRISASWDIRCRDKHGPDLATALRAV
ncbi:DUF4419 domain-containing protein [Kitasatospora viridis]|uniref:Uncharacterized protein DUF4419 n=1 Tax=Kitasatospora viridis TaxID=281105 RepID=A0A561UMD4_9ACTN|nr:DUF4419 domain-containing protein [Kitasatospora viridis]TWG00497.1 uncharacterized protein DUF4419 [Kitasatospora viridis]